MKRNLVLSVGVFLTLLCAALYLFEPLLIQSFSNNLYDAMLRLCATAPQSNAIVVVDIDEASLARHGQWPPTFWLRL